MDYDLTNLKQIHDKQAKDAEQLSRHQELIFSNDQLRTIIVQSFKTLVDYLDDRVGKTEVVNQLRSIGTPDAFKVVDAVDSLHETLKTHENTDLTEITGVMRQVLDEAKKIPKKLPKQQEIKTYDYTKQLTSLESAVKAVEKVVKEQKLVAEAPIVNVPETVVNVPKPDLKPLQKNLADVVSAVNGIVIPELDTTEIEKLIKKSNTLLNKLLEKPVSSGGGGGGGRATPYEDSNGIPAFIVTEADGSIPITVKNPGDIGGGTVYSRPSQEYELIQEDDTSDPTNYEYYGYMKADGGWYIKRVNVNNFNLCEFVAGSSSYSTNWTGRAGLTYANYGSTF